MSRKIEIPNLDNLIRRYLAGEPEHKLAREISVSRYAFHERLVKHGVPMRTQSETEKLKWARMSPAKRAAQVSAAHDAVRGVPIPIKHKIAQAQGKELFKSNISPTEHFLAQELLARGFYISQQKAVHIYNIDIAIDAPPIAVEIFGGNWHSYGRHGTRFFERTKYLLDNSWHVLIIWDTRTYPFSAILCADYIVALIQELSGNPALRRQYRVIGGNGQLMPRRQSYLNTPAVIERLSCG